MKTIDYSLTLKPEDKKNNKSLYSSMHLYVRKNYGIKNKCEFCSTTSSKRTEMALIKGRNYSFNIDDYIELCPSCHRKYDLTEELIQKHSERMKENPNQNFVLASKNKVFGDKNPHAKPILQYTINDVFIKEWSCCMDVVKELGVLSSSLSNAISGRSKTCGGFKWKLKIIDHE